MVEKAADRNAQLLQRFCKLTGYSESDIIGTNFEARRFVTSNGGKYALNSRGSEVRTLLGPAFPKQQNAAEEEESE